jgi:queuine tRNA-ribosyltransferase
MGGKGWEVVTTRGGARAILDRETMEVMHPIVGPLVEAERLYVIPSRLAERLAAGGADPLVVLDVGLGAGSNAIAAWKVRARMDAGRPLAIVSLDRTTEAMRLAMAPENASAFGFEGEAARAASALLAAGRHERGGASWRLVLGHLPSTLSAQPESSVDIVYWDPFSPRSNPSLWTATAFTALRARCRDGATVHTYSGATSVRAALLLAGFAVGTGETGETSGGKSTTIAATRAGDLARPLDRRWLERVRRSSAPLPPDAPAGALDRIAASAQFA